MKSLVLVLACAMAAEAVKIRQCSGSPWVSGSDVTLPCWGETCVLDMWSWNSVEFAFTPDRDTKSVRAHVTASIFLFPSTLANRNVCDKLWHEDGSRASCPLHAGTRYIVKDSFLVDEDAMGLPVTVKAKLIGDNDHILSCFEVKAKVVD